LIQAEWERRGRKPVIELPATTVEKGWQALSRLGMRDGDWFACLHVREGGFHGEAELGPQNVALHRSANVATYERAVDYILDQGGWVFRLGDASMSPLPFRRTRLVDYAHSDMRSPDMDLFLMSRCRYLLGTSSGPLTVCTSFGVPCGVTNYVPMADPPYSSKHLMLPKRMWFAAEGRYLSLEEMLTPPFRLANRAHLFRLFADRLGVTLKDNSPDDLLALTQDLHASVSAGGYPTDPRHDHIRTTFERGGGIYISRFSPTFLDRFEREGFFEPSPNAGDFTRRWARLLA
jgi:putative glycosyltransferase (TIGR04372 family)